MKNNLVLIALLAGLSGCATAPPPPARAPAPPPPSPTVMPPATSSLPRYRCDNNTTFSVRFADDTAILDMGANGQDTLLRDAGGVTPQQSVYSNAKLRAEFGMGANGGGAILRYLASTAVVNCTREP